MLPEQTTESWTPSSEAERVAVQQQLEKLLSSTPFNSSRRYPSFLRFVVARVLAGQTDQLKERIIGVEIFGRHADYDTNTDPIVRVTAAEIRKRIEHYYQDPQHGQEIRIYLPAGSYAPHFSWPGHPNGTVAPSLEFPIHVTELTLPHVPSTTAALDLPPSKRAFWQRRRAMLALALTAAVIASTAFWYFSRPTALGLFWGPFVKSPEPILFCIADQNQFSTIRLWDATNPQHEIVQPDTMVAIIIDDVSPLVNIAGMLRTYGRTYRVLGGSVTTLSDLRRGPSVFIGAFDNSWTLRLTTPLRFHFANDPQMAHTWIEDRANPTKRQWLLDCTEQHHTGIFKDYAIVARLIDPNTDQYVAVAAGLARGGTVAAGEFLVDAQRMNEVLSQAPRGWERKNIEIVLETQVIGSQSGPPRVDAIHVW